MMHQQIVRALRFLFLLLVVGLFGMNASLPTSAMTNRAEPQSQQRSSMAVSAVQQSSAVTTSMCNEIRVLIRTPLNTLPGFESTFDFLTNAGFNPTIKAGPLVNSDLAGYNVVILAITPLLPALTTEEVYMLQSWVAAGGSLYVLAGTNDQAITVAFGVTFDTGNLIVDPTDSAGYPYDFSVYYEKDNFSNHSIMQKIDFFSTWTAYPVVGAGEPLITADADASPSSAVLARVMQYGNGRALFVGDESVFLYNKSFQREALYWLANGFSPQYPAATYADDDNDGLSNAVEVEHGWSTTVGHYYTNPCDADSDDDGLTDGEEKDFESHPHRAISGYYNINEHKSYDWFQQPDFLLWSPELHEYEKQQWAWELTSTSQQSLLRGMLIKGQVWGPQIYGWDLPDPLYIGLPRRTMKWVNWGGVELQLATIDLRGINDGFYHDPPDFRLFVRPIGQNDLSKDQANVEADLDLQVVWTRISKDTNLSFTDSGLVVEEEKYIGEGTLSAGLAYGDPWGGSWGFSTDGQGAWQLNASYLTFGFEPTTRSLYGLEAAYEGRINDGEKAKIDVKKDSLIDFNSWKFLGGGDSQASFLVRANVPFESGQPPKCTEVIEVSLKGRVDWRIGEPWNFTPSLPIKTNYIDEKLYAILISNYYTDTTHPEYSNCNNQVSQLINSPNAMRQVIGQTHIEKSIIDANTLSQSGQTLTLNGSDETFKFVTITPFDSNGDGQNDAATVAWDADTTAAQTDLYVAVEVLDDANTFHYLYGPYTTVGAGNDAQQFNFYSGVNSFHQFTVSLFDAAGYGEDGLVNESTLSAGPGDSGIATLTAITPTISGQTATVAWRATTNQPQENLSLVFAVTTADGATTISRSGPYTATTGSEISGQFVFTAPVSGHYEGKLLLLDSNAKIEQERFIPLPLGVPATTFTGAITDAPIDTNNNGQPDALQVTAQFAFGETSDYLLRGNLLDSSGRLIDKTYHLVTKTVGIDQISLNFDSLTIYSRGQSGPYFVELSLENGGGATVATLTPAHTTAAYPLGAFGVPPATIGSNYTELPVDNNSDGLYEELRVSVQVNVSTPSTYTLSAALRGPNGDFIATATASKALAAGTQTIPLKFRGTHLHEQQISGPYKLVQLELRDFTQKAIDQKAGEYTTGAYLYTQFAPQAAQLSKSYTDFAWDTNNNGLYNYLGLGVGVTVTLPGKYRVSGSLADPNGNLVPFSSSALYYLEPGNHTIRVPFDGINIQPLGATSNFTLRAIELTDRNGAFLDRQLGDLYTTSVYQHNQFEPGLGTAPLSMLNDDMEDGRENWIADAPWRDVRASGSTAWSDHPTLPYANNTNGSLTSVPVSLENLTNAALSFRTKYVLEANADFGYVEISHDHGQSWVTLAALTGSADWHYQNISIAQYSGQPRVQVRFRLATNEAGTAQGWFVDDVKIVEASALPGPTATPTALATNTPTVTPTATNTPLPTDTPTPTNTPGPTDTPLPTATPAPDDPPTATPTPGDPPTPTATATPGSGGATMIYISSYGNGTIGGVAFNDEDIVAYNMTTGLWSLIFDGSDVGVTASVDALQVESDGSLLLSFFVDATIAGFGTVADEDIVRFSPTSLGETTAGSISWFFDGSDVELDTDDEDIDTLTRLPDGRLVIGFAGSFNAGGVSGVAHDLFLFTPTSLGETTSGSWQLYFDGSDVGLSGTNEDLWGVELAPNGDLYLNAQYAYAVPGFSGDGDDILRCTPGTLGDTTSCTYSLYWNGDSYGVGSYWLDALAISDIALVGSANAERTAEGSAAPRSQVYLPIINR